MKHLRTATLSNARKEQNVYQFQVYSIRTAINALLHFQDGAPAYITRRFDVVKGYPISAGSNDDYLYALDAGSFTRKGSFYAVNAATGTLVWEALANTGISSSPAVSNGVVYVGGGGSGYIYAFDADSGVEKWRLRTTGLMTSCPLVITLNGKADYAGDSGMMN